MDKMPSVGDLRIGDRELRITLSTRDDIEILTARGYVDLKTIHHLENAFDMAIGQSPRELIVDLTAVPFIGASGIALVIDAQQRMGGDEHLVVVTECHSMVERVMSLMYEVDSLRVYHDLPLALSDALAMRRSLHT